MRPLKATDPAGKPHNIKVEQDPDKCPVCHHSIKPILQPSAFLTQGLKTLEEIYKCPRANCAHMFIARYKRTQLSPQTVVYRLNQSLPETLEEVEVEEEISELSPSFKKIYNQALKAENYSLDEVAGVALRKAFEFLIKDFCSHKYPEKKEKIQKKFLGKCINEYVDDVKIKQCAKRAVWLGNDETHYVRKWGNHDIKDLKLLIRLSINWITNDLLTEKYLSEMEQ